MTAGHLDTTKYNNQVANAASQVKISSSVFKAFIADVKDKIDSNYDMAASITQQAIINGNFAVNQLVLSGTVTLAAGAYGHDRWKAGSGGCTYTFATVNNVTTITITAGSLVQVIEGVNLFSGTYTLSWTGTAQGKIGAGAYSGSGVTGTAIGGTNLSIEFNVGTLSKVQFNVGSIALPFQPRSYNQENLESFRYRWQSWNDGVNSPGVGSISCYALSTSSLIANVRFPVPMRIAPTISIQNNNVPNQVRNTSTGAIVTPTFSGVGGLSNKGIMSLQFISTSFTAGQYYDLDIIADAEI